MKRCITVLTAAVISGCASGLGSPGGWLTGDVEPDRYIKGIEFEGNMSVESGAPPFFEGDAQGEARTCGVVVHGEFPDDAVVAIARQACGNQETP